MQNYQKSSSMSCLVFHSVTIYLPAQRFASIDTKIGKKHDVLSFYEQNVHAYIHLHLLYIGAVLVFINIFMV